MPSEELQRRVSRAEQPESTLSVAVTSVATGCQLSGGTSKWQGDEYSATRDGNRKGTDISSNKSHPESNDDCLEITVSTCINTIIVNKIGRNISITL